ncbi:unnamed protein product [Phyllotreta striolata]|uniref:Uncharacterized protein n=1 Tax=Phyllotreta striolata TaxID=444603 RepID=A0A9N9TH05_PHYSR|nr:unnamed protein product [Phyllotreta striolata]
MYYLVNMGSLYHSKDSQQTKLLIWFSSEMDLRKHYKKFLFMLSSAFAVYFFKKYVYKKVFYTTKVKKKEPLTEFPTVEDIQKFIEELPFDALKMNQEITLKDLLGELSDFSEDEEWKELIASIDTMYNKHPKFDQGSLNVSNCA